MVHGPHRRRRRHRLPARPRPVHRRPRHLAGRDLPHRRQRRAGRRARRLRRGQRRPRDDPLRRGRAGASIDVDRAQRAQERAEAAVRQGDDDEAEAALARANARLGRHRHHGPLVPTGSARVRRSTEGRPGGAPPSRPGCATLAGCTGRAASARTGRRAGRWPWRPRWWLGAVAGCGGSADGATARSRPAPPAHVGGHDHTLDPLAGPVRRRVRERPQRPVEHGVGRRPGDRGGAVVDRGAPGLGVPAPGRGGTHGCRWCCATWRRCSTRDTGAVVATPTAGVHEVLVDTTDPTGSGVGGLLVDGERQPGGDRGRQRCDHDRRGRDRSDLAGPDRHRRGDGGAGVAGRPRPRRAMRRSAPRRLRRPRRPGHLPPQPSCP